MRTKKKKVFCIHCRWPIKKKGLCEICSELPVCRACTAIIGMPDIMREKIVYPIYRPSEEDPTLCSGCEYFDYQIKNTCCCGKTFENSEKWYIANGNFCPECMKIISRRLSKKKIICLKKKLQKVI